MRNALTNVKHGFLFKMDFAAIAPLQYFTDFKCKRSESMFLRAAPNAKGNVRHIIGHIIQRWTKRITVPPACKVSVLSKEN